VTRMFKMMSAAMLVLSTAGLSAQSDQPQTAAASRADASLKVSLVFARYQGDKKISSIPYTLWVTANQQRTSLRMGTQIPVPSTVFNKEAEKPQLSYNYRDVGTNIDCAATSVSDGTYRLVITISDSSVYYPDQSDSAVRSTTAATGAPAFRNFNSTFTLVLRDGQTAQSTSATDPVSGQIVKLDATLNVQK